MSKPKAYLKIARPHQYLKNGFIWLPLFFGYRLHDPQAIVDTLYGFVAFCLCASGIYILNDLKDIDEDRRHPIKRLRPLASGALRQSEAIGFMVILLLLSIGFSLIYLPRKFLAVLLGYLLLNFAYTGFLKRLPIIDIACIAIGFVLRVFAGGTAAGIPISHWIVIMTFLSALFLALAKRRDDLLLAESGHNTRRNIDGYSLEFISASMAAMASVIIVAYILFTVSPEKVAEHGTDQLYLTAFWVVLGFLRYLQITFVEQRSGSPTVVFIKDHFLKVVVILWIISFYLLIYGFK